MGALAGLYQSTSTILESRCHVLDRVFSQYSGDRQDAQWDIPSRLRADRAQDVLGILYAQPPIGQPRYRRPQSINESSDRMRNGLEYGLSCMQDGQDFFALLEDRLAISAAQPAGIPSGPLPVLIRIHGDDGGSSIANQRHNPSSIVKVSPNI
ncbi:hypothetical protein F4779DRAFT_241324 [Xylariaceae sp. FL0662B]|nr:hypothetical protein F4779DRAFT_241324 [Xylariaceae sp. FL0662B]